MVILKIIYLLFIIFEFKIFQKFYNFLQIKFNGKRTNFIYLYSAKVKFL